MKELIVQLVTIVADKIAEARSDQLKDIIGQLEETVGMLREQLEYRRFVEKERLKQRDAAAIRGRHRR